jgi:hypothetical protein
VEHVTILSRQLTLDYALINSNHDGHMIGRKAIETPILMPTSKVMEAPDF